MKVGKRLKELIQNRGLTPAQVSRLAGIKPQRLSDWLGDAAVRDLKQLKAVCNVLQVSLDELLFGEATTIKSITSLDSEDQWVTGQFEIKIRRIK